MQFQQYWSLSLFTVIIYSKIIISQFRELVDIEF